MWKSFTATLLCGMVMVLLTFVYLAGVTFLEIPESGKEMAKTIVPFLMGNVFSSLIGYYWGASKVRTKQGTGIDTPELVSQIEECSKIDVAKIEANKAVESAKTE
jgi:hypothetical protein